MKLSSDDAVRYHTKIDDRLGGPYSVEGLESLVYLQRITPDTLIGRENSGVFQPVRETELGPVLFKSLNRARQPHDWAPPGKEHHPEHTNRQRHRLGEARFDRVNRQHPRKGRIEVTDILQDIRQSEIVSGRDHLRQNRFRITKRTKDFWILLIAGNTLLLGGAIAMQNTVSLVFGIGGSGLYTFALLWSMYGVMGRY